MTLRDMITDDATAVFLNTDEFAESVTYYPFRYPGTALRSNRTITAVVIREQIQAVTQDGSQTVLPRWEVHVANDSTAGISSDEIDLGGDQIGFPPRDGQTAERRSIVRLVTQDSGMLVLECL
jgi:hypothetical protein